MDGALPWMSNFSTTTSADNRSMRAYIKKYLKINDWM